MTGLQGLARAIDRLNETIGRAVSWLALIMVLVQFIVVVLRYVFGAGSIFVQESIVYMHAIVFLVGAGYTLLHNGHVRVDIFYGAASERRKALVDLVGIVVFLWPICILIWWVSWPFVTAAWDVLEGSPEGSGIQGVYLLKTVILVFSVLLAVQGVSLAIACALKLAGIEADVGQTEEEEAVL